MSIQYNNNLWLIVVGLDITMTNTITTAASAAKILNNYESEFEMAEEKKTKQRNHLKCINLQGNTENDSYTNYNINSYKIVCYASRSLLLIQSVNQIRFEMCNRKMCYAA